MLECGVESLAWLSAIRLSSADDFEQLGLLGGGLRGDAVGFAEQGEWFGQHGFGGSVEGYEGLVGGDAVAQFGVDFDAGVGVDRASGDEAACAEALYCPAGGDGVDGGEEARRLGVHGGGGADLVEAGGVVEDGGVSALGLDHAQPGLVSGATDEELVGYDCACFGRGCVAGEVEHPAGEQVGELDEVG